MAAPELEIRSSGSAEPALDLVASAFSAATDVAVKITYDDKIVTGTDNSFDVVLASRDALARDYIPMGKIQGAGISIGSIGLGVTIRAGVPAPDISDLAAFSRLLDSADAMILTSHTTGFYVEARLKALGIFSKVADKLERFPNGPLLMRRLMQGGGLEFGVLSANQIRRYADKGLVLLGPVPEEMQYAREFAVAPMTASCHPALAQAFVRFCAEEGRPFLASCGFK